ncbi:hypothetical protein PGH07_08265 [Sulfurovum sp. zt1-1]|uniref:Lipoprotein n=1 Tax=Sulfurovum zhangzhouensis TaxID=3019067 RepID=A0ABT7QZA5_9BACT|nr:hypothetical protein [Sulfurovum zhangzhouensis]MDM5272172.1 hypothetical protein [Sulfurovum zhangzhouensis]
MKYLALAGVTAALIFTGCSSKKYFEPEQTFSASKATGSYESKIISVNRDGATLENGRYISKKEGIRSISLTQGYRLLSENNRYVLASNIEGSLKVIDKDTRQTVSEITFDSPVVTASLQGGKIAYILNNNSFGLYNMNAKKKMLEEKSDETYAIDVRTATPIFIDSLTVFPMLDGKLIIVNGYDTTNAKVVYLSSEKAFNNVIYLSRTGNTVVAATPKTLFTLGEAGEQEYQANISDVVVSDGMIYLFTKEGEIVKLNKALNVIKNTKFKFAHYSVATVDGGKVYALDQQGSLIVLDTSLTKSKIYDVGKVKHPAFISGTKLYKDGDVIELSKLGYE